jgi:TonB-dependent starch-binding outer membrane protein SusC
MKKTLFLFILIFTSITYSQNDRIKITGKVYDDKGIPLAGVKIQYESNSFSTDFDGSYTLNVKDSKSFLTFSFVGFTTKIVTVGEQREINVTLYESNNKLEEIVVIGYGTQKRGNVTGSVTKIKSEKIEQAPVQRLDQALQGKIAGVQIQNTSSEAGSDTKINIRGISSINANSGPLVVVDGQPIPDGFASINSADVESIEVLKDAASAAIYGSRGAGGVILITTKSGKSDKPKFTFRTTSGFKRAYKIYDQITSTELLNLSIRDRDLRAQDPSFPAAQNILNPSEISQYYVENVLLGGKATKYQDEILRDGYYQDTQFSFSGGNKDFKYFTSFAYQKDQAMMIKSENERINLRAKIDINLTKKLKLNVNLNPSNVKTEYPGANFTDFYRFPSFLPKYHTQETIDFIRRSNPGVPFTKLPGDIAEAIDFPATNTIVPAQPTYSFVHPNGETLTSSTIPFNTANVNPWNSITNREQNQNQFRFQGSTALTYEVIKGLSLKSTANTYYRDTERFNFFKTGSRTVGSVNQGQYINGKFFDFLTENTLNYKKEIGKHNFDFLAGYTYQSTENSASQITGNGYANENVTTLSNATIIETANTFGTKEKVFLQSILGRLNYSYMDKYLLSVSFRTDGSSLFKEGNRWGQFPAASVGWVISKENFMTNAQKINRLNLRASYGLSGNNRIPANSNFDYLTSTNYLTGSGSGSITPGVSLSNNVIYDENLTWERTYQTNLGIDFAAFSNRLNLTVDVFQSKTEKLLLEKPTLAVLGGNKYLTNIGSLENKGFEFELSTKNINKENFKWETAINLSAVKNKILNFGDVALLRNLGERNEIYQNVVGSPLIEFYGFKTDGVWLSQAQIDGAIAGGLTSSGIQNVFTPGGLKVVDVNNDGKLDLNDRTVIGNPYPDFTYGMTNSFKYKNIDLSFSIQGVQGGEVINGDQNFQEIKQRNVDFINNRWVSPANPGDGRTPYSVTGVNIMLTDYVVEDASYASLREVNLAYNFSKKNLEPIGISGLKISLSGQNLLFWMPKSYFGINPESRYSSSPYNTPLYDGYQRGGFPIPRTILMGVELNF